jgi:NADPH-dependent ferric siderophore reductase
MPSVRVRREPPAFRTVEVVRTERLTPRMVRVTLDGPELAGFTADEPAASVRLLLPSSPDLALPAWNGNEFLLSDGSRPVIRTLTPRVSHGTLVVDIVLHGPGAASDWAENAAPGDRVAVSGPGRGYTVDPDAPAFLLAGDETAIPAMAQVVAALPAGRPADVHVELADTGARLPTLAARWHVLPAGATPGDALVAAVRSAHLEPDVRVWVAGEAAAVQRVRRYLFEERGLSRRQTTVRGYWKHGRAGQTDGD